MFRKIFFIFLSIIAIDVFLKGVILLSVSFISLFLVLQKQPFILSKLNDLEYKSNFAALITLFVGNLYLCDISQVIQDICFVLILLTNTLFFCNFLFNVLYLLLHIHFEKLYKLSPRLTTFITSIFISLNKFEITSLNIPALKKMFHTRDGSHTTFATSNKNLSNSSFYPKTKIDDKKHSEVTKAKIMNMKKLLG